MSKPVDNVTEFYVPTNFRKQVKWMPSEQRGKLLNFPSAEDIRFQKSEPNALPARRIRWPRWP